MATKITRSREAGINFGKAIVEMVHLMYQNNTAAHFYMGLLAVLKEELLERGIIEKNDS
ncbi:MAG TPA: hypothetical protein VMV86_02935 [Methanosarcinales archaeon]|nr:hypothetical protein [Methanosarcinales archaeon]